MLPFEDSLVSKKLTDGLDNSVIFVINKIPLENLIIFYVCLKCYWSLVIC